MLHAHRNHQPTLALTDNTDQLELPFGTSRQLPAEDRVRHDAQGRPLWPMSMVTASDDDTA